MNKQDIGSSFTSGINWDKVKVYQPGEEPSPFGVKVDYDPEVEKMNNSFVKDLESKIENKPNEIIEDPSMPSEAKEEAVQVLDGDKRTDEANNDKVETAVEKLSEDFDTVDDLAKYLDNFDDEGNPFFPEDKENPDAVWNKYENPAEAYRNYVDPEDTEKWEEYLKSKEVQPEAEAEAELAEAQIDPVAAAQKALSTPVLNEELPVSEPTNGISSGSGSESLPVDRMNSIGSSFSHALANLGTGSGQSSAPSVESATSANNKTESVTSHAGGGEIPNELPNASVSSRNSSSNGYVTSNGGSYNSGGVKHTGNSLKAHKAVLPSGDSKDQPASADIDLKDAHIENLEQRIRSIPQALAEQLGFGVKSNVTYNGQPIDKCGPKELEEIENILGMLGI